MVGVLCAELLMRLYPFGGRRRCWNWRAEPVFMRPRRFGSMKSMRTVFILLAMIVVFGSASWVNAEIGPYGSSHAIEIARYELVRFTDWEEYFYWPPGYVNVTRERHWTTMHIGS